MYRDHPLALYVFSNDAATKKRVFDNTQSGSVIANECNIHVGGLSISLFTSYSNVCIDARARPQRTACPLAVPGLADVSSVCGPEYMRVAHRTM